MNFSKFNPWRKGRMQPALVSTEDGRIVDTALPVELGYLLNEPQSEGYVLCPDAIIPQRGTRVGFVILDERDAAPQPINKKATESRAKFEAEINRIAKGNRRQAFHSITQALKMERFQEVLILLVLMTGSCFVLIEGITFAVSKIKGG
jgi:hypothetical protein